MMSRTFWFVAMLSIAVVASPAPALAQNEALRGKTAMSVYVSLVGDTGYGVNGAELRLSLEQQLHDMGINVLSHADPPNFPVLNLTVNARVWEEKRVVETVQRGVVTNTDVVTVRWITYTSKIELRQLAPGRTAATRPIEDVAIWTKAAEEKTVGLEHSWQIPGDALDVGIDFVNAWQRVNGSNHAATQDRPMPLPNPNAPSPPSSEPGQSLYEGGGGCEVRAGGGCVALISRVVTDSVEGVPNAHEEMVKKQLADLQQRGQKVITCVYGPINTQAKTGYVTFHYWYQSAPPDILKMLVSAFPHPFMNLGRVAVAACPATKALASVINANRYN
jgi:hypothetical protein